MATYNLVSNIPTKIQTGDILNCPYSGSKKTITLPKGQYQLECWGAQGGYRSSSTYGGKGGYSKGTLTLNSSTTLYLYSGGAGNTQTSYYSSPIYNGGFNGGGRRHTYKGGGGGTDIRIGQDSLYARVIVAGGGGSDGAPGKQGMYGGGSTGGSASQSFGSYGYGGTATGNTGGFITTTQPTGATSSSHVYAGFGFGGNGVYYANGYAGAGGGGWYGGAGSYPDGSGDDDRGGGGGSGYVYTSGTASQYPSGCLLNSLYYLTDASTAAGNTSFTDPDTGNATTGRSGNGYIRITVLLAIQESSDNFSIKVSANQELPSSYTRLPYIESTGTQLINTKVTTDSNTKITMTLAPSIIADSTIGALFFASTSTYQGNGIECYYWGGKLEGHINSSIGQSTTSIAKNEKIYIDYQGTTYKLYGVDNKENKTLKTSITHSTTPASSSSTLYLFGLIRGYYGAYKLYDCKVYNGSTLQRNFIPAMRNSDYKIGLYDLQNNTFYTDATGGNFVGSSYAIDSATKYLFKGSTLSNSASSGYSFTNNGVTISSDQKKFETSSMYFNGTSNYITLNTSITNGTSDWTVDWWEYQVGESTSSGIYHQAYDSGGAYGVLIGYRQSGRVSLYTNNGTNWGTSNAYMGDVQLNTWVHRAAVRKNNTYYLFENGTLKTTIADSYSYANSMSPTIGIYKYINGQVFYFNGYIDNLRISSIARWTSDFTPPTKEYGNLWKKIKDVYLKKDSTTWIKKEENPLDGKTLTNLLTNTSFENTGWRAGSAVTIAYDSSIKRTGSYSLKASSTSSSESLIYNTTNPYLTQNHIYYISVYLYQDTQVCSSMQVYWPEAEPVFGTCNTSSSYNGQWQRLGWRNGRTSWSSGNHTFRFDFEGMAANTTCYIDDAMIIDLTEVFGSGNEPSLEWCNENIPYFEGTRTFTEFKIYLKTKSNPSLPFGYEALEYIESTGSQYINTGFIPKYSTRINLDIKFTDLSANSNIFCARSSANGNDTQSNTLFYIASGKKFRRDYYGYTASIGDIVEVDKKYNIDCDFNTTKINGVSESVATSSTASTTYMPLLLLASGASTAANSLSSIANFAKAKLYRCQIYDNGTLVRDFYPAKRTSDGIIGLYDKVNSVFHTGPSANNFLGDGAYGWTKVF